MLAPKIVGKMSGRSQNTNDSLKESNDLKRWNAELEIDRSHFETIRTADTEINLCVIIIVTIIFIMLCQCTWLILHSRKFNYSTRYIKCNKNDLQARKLNESDGFLVSSLNNLGSRQQVKSKEIQWEKTSRKNLLCCFTNKTKNYFIVLLTVESV